MKTGILVHGFNLQADNWRRVVWGDAPEGLGRVPQALLIAHKVDAEVIVMGTGASKRKFAYPDSDRFGEELLEGEYTFEYLKSFFDQMRYFKPWMDIVSEAHQNETWEPYKQKMLSKIELELHSQNTVEELQCAAEIFLKHEVEQVMLVSSPTHIVRVLRDADGVFQKSERFAKFRHHIHAVPCVTCYKGTRASDVVVLEPPHRPDRRTNSVHHRIRRMLELQKLGKEDLGRFDEDLETLLKRYEELYAEEEPTKCEVIDQRTAVPTIAVNVIPDVSSGSPAS